MGIDRRDFLKIAMASGGATLLTNPTEAKASAEVELNPDRWGMLVDTTLCIGCRHCEWACKRQNELPSAPLAEFSDTSAFDNLRRPDAESYTVVNRFPNPKNPDRPIYAKVQCMHCEDAGCVSACLVGALQKEKDGPVSYDAWKCMGCRYCMVACPFQVPAYEYFNALNPRVMKCTFCMERVKKDKDFPACAKICPQGVLTFGKRVELLQAARERMAKAPDRYVPHIYGEHEVGGTAWLYLAEVPFEKLGFLTLGEQSVPHLNESIQHSIFKHFIPPLALYSVLGALMWNFRDKNE